MIMKLGAAQKSIINCSNVNYTSANFWKTFTLTIKLRIFAKLLFNVFGLVESVRHVKVLLANENS